MPRRRSSGCRKYGVGHTAGRVEGGRLAQRDMEPLGGSWLGDLTGAVEEFKVAPPTARLGNEAGEMELPARHQWSPQRCDESGQIIEEVGEANAQYRREATERGGHGEKVGLHEANARRDASFVLVAGESGALSGPFQHASG